MGLNIDEQKAVDRFRNLVVDPSMTKLVILDFWAEWCGPCKALSPVLEKVAADYAEKGVILAKINVDEERFIAAQFQVKSIPTVYAMFQGQPVADLTNARGESQLKQMLDQILGQLPVQPGAAEPVQDVDPLIAMGHEVLDAGDGERALSIFAQIIELAPDNVPAQAGLIRALITTGRTAEARASLDALSPEVAKDPLFAQVQSALALAEDAPDSSELDALRAAATANPADNEARFAFAGAAFAAGARDEAADVLLAMVQAEPGWSEGAAKAKLLQIFEAVGLEDPWVAATRRRLSLILFG